jgi:WD40 repeat protein
VVKPKEVRTDLYGDPLPPGALARLGTARFRHDSTAIAYSPDGKVLASGGSDNVIRLFDASTGMELRRLAGHLARTFNPSVDRETSFDLLVGSMGKGAVTSVAFSPDGKTLASGGWDEMVRLWDLQTGKELNRLVGHKDGMVATVVFSPDGKYLASRGGNDGTVILWDASSGKEIRRHEKVARISFWRFNRDMPLAFTPDSKALVAGDRKVVRFWDVATGQETRQLEVHGTFCASLAFSADGRLLATGGDDKDEDCSLRLWDVETGKELQRCQMVKHDYPPISLAFCRQGTHLASVWEEQDSYIHDVSTGKVVHRLNHHWASRLVCSPDGQTVVTAGNGCEALRHWDAATGKELFLEFEGHLKAVSSVAVSPDGKYVASAGEDVRIWDAATSKQVRQIGVSATAVAFSPDSQTLASAGTDAIVHLWAVATGNEIGSLKGHGQALHAVAFSRDGKTLASGDAGSAVRLWDLTNRKELHCIDMKSATDCVALAFSPDGKSLACAGVWNDTTQLPPEAAKYILLTRREGYFALQWDVATGKETRRFGGLKYDLRSVAFSPDGKTLAAASRDGRIALWDAATGKERLYIVAHPSLEPGPVSLMIGGFRAAPCLAFALDGQLLASTSTDGTIRLWSPTTGKELGQFQVPEGGFCSPLAFAPEGKGLVSAAGGAVLIWDPRFVLNAPGSSKPKSIGFGE